MRPPLNALPELWRHASLGFRRTPPDLKKRMRRNLIVAGACTGLSGELLVSSLIASPHVATTAALNTGLLIAIGYYFTRTAKLLVWHGKNQENFDAIDANLRLARLGRSSELTNPDPK
jgi:hypothetical protein